MRKTSLLAVHTSRRSGIVKGRNPIVVQVDGLGFSTEVGGNGHAMLAGRLGSQLAPSDRPFSPRPEAVVLFSLIITVVSQER